MTILLCPCQLIFDFLSDGVESYASGPDDETGGEFVFCDCAGGIFGGVPDSVFGDFGDTGIGYDIDFVVSEFTFCVVTYLLVVSIENVRLRLDDMHGNLVSQQRRKLKSQNHKTRNKRMELNLLGSYRRVHLQIPHRWDRLQ